MRKRTGLVAAIMAISCACSRDPQILKQKYIESGDGYFKRAKYAEAAVQYANAVRQDPESGPARMHLADAQMAGGNTKAAFPEYIRAADLMPGDFEAQLKAGGLLLNAGLFEDAKNRARAILKKDPRNVRGLVLMGNALAGLKQIPEAVGVVDRAIEIDPERAGVYTNLGVLQLAQGDLQQAERAFKRAAEVNDQSVDARVNLANFYRALKRFPDAEDALKRAFAVAPKDLRLNQALASMYVEWNKLPQAEPYLQTVVALANTAESRFALADYLVAVGRLPDAVATLSDVATDKEHFVEAKSRMALLLFAGGERDRATKIVEEVLTREPRSAAALAVKARLQFAENRVFDALATIKLAIEIDPRRPTSHLTLARIQLALNQVEDARKAFIETLQLDPRSLPAQLELIELHRRRSEIDTALHFADEAVVSRPENARARIALIRTLLIREKDWPRAEREVRELLAKHPNSPDALNAVASLFLRRNDQAAARRAFERAVELDSSSLEATSGLVALDLSSKRVRDASGRIELALARQGDSPALLLLGARVYALAGNPAKVEDLLKRVLVVDPGNPEGYTALGQLYAQQGRLDEAKRYFADVVRLEPHSVVGPTMLGLLAYVQKDLPEAQRWWWRALEIDPRAGAAANNLAWVIAELEGNLDQALQLAQTAKAKYPAQPDINDTLGWIYYKKHATTQALSFLLQSIDQDPSNAMYQFHLGMTYAQAGEDAKARRALERALALQKDFDGAPLARKTLATLVY